jgi:uncharacterized protein YggT (Ycf19 family)
VANVSTHYEIKVPAYLTFSKVLVWLMYFWVMIGVVSLALRVFLLAFSANMTAGFANFVLRVSNDYMEPFRGIFTGRGVGETGYLDVSALFAIIVYLFVAWGFKALIEFVDHKIAEDKIKQGEQLAKLEREETLKRIEKALPKQKTAVRNR